MTDIEHVPGFAVEAFFAADHAVTAEGKLFVNGGFWDRMQFPVYPAAVPYVSVVAVVRVPFRHYYEDHKFAVGIEDADGQPLEPRAEGEFRVGAAPDLQYGDASVMQVVVPFANLLIPRPGDFSFTLEIDGERLAHYPIRARQIAIPMRLELSEQPPDEGGAD